MAESGSGSGSQGPVNFHRPHLKMLVEDANTSKDIRDTISRPLHLLGTNGTGEVMRDLEVSLNLSQKVIRTAKHLGLSSMKHDACSMRTCALCFLQILKKFHSILL
nr:hypothetical protein CFP56_58648 [Quercus suber]